MKTATITVNATMMVQYVQDSEAQFSPKIIIKIAGTSISPASKSWHYHLASFFKYIWNEINKVIYCNSL